MELGSGTLGGLVTSGQAQKLHPDHVSDPAKKAEATRQFQRLSEVYQTLRDPTKQAPPLRPGQGSAAGSSPATARPFQPGEDI